MKNQTNESKRRSMGLRRQGIRGRRYSEYIFTTDTSERKVKVGLQIPVLSVNTPSTLWEQGQSAQKRACKDNKYEHTCLNVQNY